MDSANETIKPENIAALKVTLQTILENMRDKAILKSVETFKAKFCTDIKNRIPQTALPSK